MKMVFYLGTCGTCKKIIQEADLVAKGFALQDIKKQPLSPEQLDSLKELAGSYESLFSRRSQQYAARGLKDQALSEADYRKLILEEYTFLKRPVVVDGERIYVGSEKKTVEALLNRK
jgi:arsenate reductase